MISVYVRFSSRRRLQEFPRLQLSIDLMFDDVEHNIAQFPRGARRNHFFIQFVEPLAPASYARRPELLRKSPASPGTRHFPHISAEALREK